MYRMEYGYSGSLKPLPSCYRATILPAPPEPVVPEAAAEAEEPREDAEQEVSEEEQPCTDPSHLTEMQGKISEELDDEDSRVSPSEETDVPGELAPKGTGANPDGSLERSYVDGTLPDLIRSGRPLGRRRTLGHVSETVGQWKPFFTHSSFTHALEKFRITDFLPLYEYVVRIADWILLQLQPVSADVQ